MTTTTPAIVKMVVKCKGGYWTAEIREAGIKAHAGLRGKAGNGSGFEEAVSNCVNNYCGQFPGQVQRKRDEFKMAEVKHRFVSHDHIEMDFHLGKGE